MMQDTPVFDGVGVALLTLFDERGEVDLRATADHAATLVELGMRAVVVGGTTGEAATLEPVERRRLVEAVRDAVGSDAVVIAGTGAPSGRQASELTVQSRDAGADAALVLSPHRVADPRPYYEAVAKAAGDLPLLAYHFPAASPPGIATQYLGDLPVVGMKDSTGDPERLMVELAEFPGHLYAGSSAILAFAGPMGCTGAILALANARPEECLAAFAADTEAQKALLGAHLEMRASFPQGIKALAAARFGTSRVTRL